MTQTHFDCIVIGAGSGGLNVAGFMNRLGLSILLIDKSDTSIGGDCLNFGCVPSKALIHVAKQLRTQREATQFGPQVTGMVSWDVVKEYVRSRQEIIREHENATWFRQKGMTVVLGEARFVDERTVAVDGVRYQAPKIIVATGSRPRRLAVPGVERVQSLVTNETVFTMPQLPRRLLVIGAGPIGVEMASAFADLGSQVVIVDTGARLLPREDADVVAILSARLAARGVRYLGEVTLESFLDSTTAQFRTITGTTHTETFDTVLVAIGRVPNTESLNVTAASIRLTDRGYIETDAYLRTTNRRVFAVGDVTGREPFTHGAELQAATVLRNFFTPFPRRYSAAHFGWTIFTDPQIATFGESPTELTARGVQYEVITQSCAEDDRAITDGYQDGLLKLYISKKGVIFGGTMVAPQAGELVQELMLAQSAGLTIGDLFNKVYPYPLATRINKRLAQQWSAKRLTPAVTTFLRIIYTLSRGR